MDIAEEKREGVLVVAPRGRLDSNTCDALEARLTALVSAGEKRLVLDLSGLDYVSSAGLRVFLLVSKRLREGGGRLALCAMSPGVRQIFELAGFLPLFTIEASPEAALARLAS